MWVGKDTEADLAPEHFRVTWEGRVLWLGERSWHDDSDFYAMVWDDETESPREVTYASTRGWTYNNGAAVDADEATQAKYAAWQDRLREQRAELARRAEEATPRRGKRVRVVRGRKVPVGTEGEVIWYGDKGWGLRVGVRDDAGTVHWVDAKYVEVLAPAAA